MHGSIIPPEFDNPETTNLEAIKLPDGQPETCNQPAKAIKKLHEYFDKTYLINLDRRKDRLDESILECGKYGIVFERFRACDGQTEIADLAPAAKVEARLDWNKSAAGLCISLIRLLEKCKKENVETLLIMEDDVQFNPKIYSILDDAMKQVPENWESIFFGIWNDETIPISRNIHLIKFAYAAHCHALKKDVFQFLIDKLSVVNNPLDHIYYLYLFPRGKSYVIKPHLAWQRASFSDLTGYFYSCEGLIPSEYLIPSADVTSLIYSRIKKFHLNPESENLKLCIDHCRGNTADGEPRCLVVDGWAFIEGYGAENSQVYLVLQSHSATYVFDTVVQRRPDVTAHFESLNLNLDSSGFVAIIPIESIQAGIYKLGIYVTKGDVEALQSSDKTVLVPSASGYFDNGVKITKIIERIYASSDTGATGEKSVDPFLTGKGSFYAWLNDDVNAQTGAYKITNLWYEVYKLRPDLRNAFPDIFGADRKAFCQWGATSGKLEYELEDAFIPKYDEADSEGKMSDRLNATNKINQYIESHDVLKLQVGCGQNLLDGWLNSDIRPPNDDVMFLDARAPLPFQDNILDYIFTEHSIGQLTYNEAAAFLRECLRTLKLGGKIRIATTDLSIMIGLYNAQSSEIAQRYMKFILSLSEPHSPLAPEAYYTLVLNQWYRGWDHKFVYDFTTLKYLLGEMGFRDIKREKVGISDDPNLNNIERHGWLPHVPPDLNELETMVIEAVKPPDELVSGGYSEQIVQLGRQLQQLEKSLTDSNNELKYMQNVLAEITRSITWRAARKLHRVIDRILPPATGRRRLVKRIVLMITNSKQ